MSTIIKWSLARFSKKILLKNTKEGFNVENWCPPNFRAAYDSIDRLVLYKVLIEFEVLVKFIKLIGMKMTYITRFSTKLGLNQSDWLAPALFNIIFGSEDASGPK